MRASASGCASSRAFDARSRSSSRLSSQLPRSRASTSSERSASFTIAAAPASASGRAFAVWWSSILYLASAALFYEIATVERRVSRRDGKVYLDYLQNGHGKLIAAPFCVRPGPGAPVSMPLDWSEVEDGLAIEQHTIRTAPARMTALGGDPLAAVLEEEPDLVAALERLMGWFG